MKKVFDKYNIILLIILLIQIGAILFFKRQSLIYFGEISGTFHLSIFNFIFHTYRIGFLFMLCFSLIKIVLSIIKRNHLAIIIPLIAIIVNYYIIAKDLYDLYAYGILILID